MEQQYILLQICRILIFNIENIRNTQVSVVYLYFIENLVENHSQQSKFAEEFYERLLPQL